MKTKVILKPSGLGYGEAPAPGGGPGLVPPGPRPIPGGQQLPNSPLLPPKQPKLPDPKGFLPQSGPLSPAQLATSLGAANRMNATGAPGPVPPQNSLSSSPGAYGAAVQAGGLFNNQEAQTFQKNTGYMPSTTVGGGYGQFALGPGGGKINPAADQQIAHDKLVTPGNFYNSLLPGYGVTGAQRPAPAAPAAPANFAAGEALLEKRGYKRGPEGFVGSPGMNPKTAEAKATFDARRGGVAQRQADYQDRTSFSQWARKGNAAANGMARGEARRLGRGNLTFEERLSAADPMAAAQKQLGQGQQDLARAQFQASQNNLQANREFQAGEGEKNRASALERAKLGAQVAADKAGVAGPLSPPKPQGKPLAALSPVGPNGSGTSVPPEVHDKVREAASKGDLEGAREELVRAGITDKGQ